MNFMAVNSSKNNSYSCYNKIVVRQYFESSKYSLVNDSPVSSNVNSSLWNKWLQNLTSKKVYYNQLQFDLQESLPVSVKSSLVEKARESNDRVDSSNYYSLESKSSNVSLKRKKVNFFVYRKFRFNQLRLFYSTCNQKQFKKLHKSYVYTKKRALDSFLLSLEGRLEFFLYRTNMFPSKYFIRQFLNHHGVLVNGYLVRNKNYQLKPFDVVSIPRSQHKHIFGLLKSRTALLKTFSVFSGLNSVTKKAFFKRLSSLNISPIFSLSFFMNYPRYIEVDYVLLEAMIIRNPSIQEVLTPFNSEIDSTNRSYYNW